MEAKAIIDAVLDFDQEKTAQLVRAYLDQGVDISKGKFLAAAKKYQAHIVALSALLTTTLAEMEAVVADVRAKGGGRLKTLVERRHTHQACLCPHRKAKSGHRRKTLI